MLKYFLRARKYLLIAAICLSFCAMSGCVESIFYLKSDSRFPKWIALPPGLSRRDVRVVLESMEPTRGDDIKIVMTDRKYKKLAEMSGKTIGPILSRSFFIEVVNGLPEIIGLTQESDGNGGQNPLFYVVDDPALKKKLLDENGVSDPALRKQLLDGELPKCTNKGTNQNGLSQNSEGGPCPMPPK